MARYLTPLLIFIGFGLYYFTTACPTFYFWDSAELTAAILSNGVPHPPGFPFFLLLAEAWAAAIGLDPTYALNLFSAIFAAFGLSLWYLAIRQLLTSLDPQRRNFMPGVIALLSVALMGVSFTYSIQATRLEVYSLNFAGFACLVLLAMRIARNELNGSLTKGVFFVLLGLMLSVHSLTTALAVPGLFVLAGFGRSLRPRDIALGAPIALIISLALYLFIFARAYGDPTLNWGDPSNTRGILDYILMRDFSVAVRGDWLEHLADQARFFGDVLSRQLGLPGLLMSLLGGVYFILNRRRAGFGFVLILVLNFFSISLAASYFYENYDIHGYLVISLAIATLFLAAGIEFIFQLLSQARSRSSIRMATAGAGLLALLLGAAIGVEPARRNVFSADLSDISAANSFAFDFLNEAPDSAVILTSSYNTYFCLLAYQAAGTGHEDKTIMNIYNWDHKWGRGQTNDLIGADLSLGHQRQDFYRTFVNEIMSRRPLYIEYDRASKPLARYLYPRGLGYVLLTDADSCDAIDIGDEVFLSEAKTLSDIESIRTWVLWLQNRGEYYRDRGLQEMAESYFAALDTVASNVDLK
jgi:hypothetical protein